MSGPVWSWPQFARKVRRNAPSLLAALPRYPDSVLVTGCQRSGTTVLTRLFLESPAFVDYRSRLDSELLGALLLCGRLPPPRSGRYCFQTTFLNERYQEYYHHQGNFRMIYLLRNPFSVVYSMCHHWKRRSQLRNFALNELFAACGRPLLTSREQQRYSLFGPLAIPRVRRASLAYVGKVSQLFELHRKLAGDLLVLEYDQLIQHREPALSLVCSFAGIPFDRRWSEVVHSRSVNRADRLGHAARQEIRQSCWPVYERAREYAVRLE